MTGLHMTITDATRDRRTFAPEGEGTGGDTTTTTTADTTTTTAADTTTQTQTAPKWWEGETFSAEEKQWLAARGLTEDDPLVAIPKMVKGHRAAEARIGKGLDTIIDRPAKDQPFTDWIAQNREALGLPKDEAGYQVQRPEAWPKGAPWNEASEAKVRAVGVKYGLHPEAVQEIVNIAAQDALQTYQDAAAMGEEAKRTLMADMEKQYGDQTPKVIQKARLGAQAVAEKAGLQMDAVANLSDMLTDKIGDANAIRFMAAIGDMLGDDTALGMGKGGTLTTTPAEARAELARLRGPDGEYAKAFAKGDRAEMERLRPRMDSLTRIATGG